MHTYANHKAPRLIDDYRNTVHEKHIHPELRIENLQLFDAASRKKYHLLDMPLATAITGWQARKLRYRLRFLTLTHHLKRYRIPGFKDKAKPHPHTYELGRAGARVLAIRDRGVSEDYLPTRKSGHPSYQLSPHTVELGRVRLALERSAAQLDATLTCHYDDRRLAKGYRMWPTLPDGYTAIEFKNGVQAFFFLKHVRDTANLSKVWEKKFRGYLAILNEGYFTRNFFPSNPGIGFRVLITVPTNARMHSLLRACHRQVPYSPIDFRTVFNFALLKDVESRNAFVDPIWWRADLSTKSPIF